MNENETFIFNSRPGRHTTKEFLAYSVLVTNVTCVHHIGGELLNKIGKMAPQGEQLKLFHRNQIFYCEM